MRHLFYCLLCCLCVTAAAQTGELPRSTPQAQGVDPNLLNRFLHDLTHRDDVDIHHMMVLRHGKVIGEWHAAPYRATDLHTLYSASKTVTALAVGLAVDDGLLAVDDKVSRHLRDKMPAKLTPALDSLTVRNLLMMAAGREPDLSIPEGDADWLTAWFAGDFHGVGQRFTYDNMCTHVLAMIVTRVTGRSMLDYVKERIFNPLHITHADWEMAPDSVETAAWGLRLQAESEAKLGLLMLQQGQWNGKQVVSRQWIHDMTQRLISTQEPGPRLPFKQRFVLFFKRLWHEVRSWFTGYNVDDYFLGYGYQTKAIQHPRAECFFAAGYGGQLIYVVPSLDMVIVVNGRAANYGVELNTIYYRLINDLIADTRPSQAVPAVSLAIEPPRGQSTHPLEEQLIGCHVVLDSNVLRLQSIDVTRQGEALVFTMTDPRGPLRVVADRGQWRLTTSDERPIYIMECREQLLGIPRPFTMAAACAWQGDTLALRVDWIDGGDNRRLKMVLGRDHTATVIVNDNFDPLLTDTISGRIRN